MNSETGDVWGQHDCAEEVGRIAGLVGERDWEALAEEVGLDVDPSPIPPGAAGAWGLQPDDVEAFEELSVLAAQPGVTVLLLAADVPYRTFRRTAFAVDAHNPAACVVWWWVRRETLELVLVDESEDDGRFVRRMALDLDAPERPGLRQWARLQFDDPVGGDVVDPARATRRHVRDVLRQEPVTRQFFEAFREALETLGEQVEEGPDDERARRQVALATLLRLVFVYFLQHRGALGGDDRFVVRQLRRARRGGRDFYQTVLRPLFFGALNRRPERREPSAERLGEIPFLNGGLFEALAVESDHDEMRWPDEVWNQVVEGFLERYQFTVDEGIGDDRARAVAPEMLGKVFEGLMYEEARLESGSFYTPRNVVETIVRRALANYLVESVEELDSERAREIVAGRSSVAEESVHERLVEAVEGLRLLDPAVGTGAFLLEALHVVERLYDVLDIDVGGADEEFARRRAIIHRHLFGVDIQQTATRICELRLWLALLAVMPGWTVDQMPPLPNLGHRIACGHSLLSPTDLRHAEGAGGAGSAMALSRRVDEKHCEEMRDLQEEYVSAHGPEKVDLRRRMEGLETQMQRRILEARREVLEERLEPLERLEESEDLFGDQVELTAEQRRERATVVERLEEVDEALGELEEGRRRRGGFSFASRFGPVLDGGGFDVVVTNPPWIRANRLDGGERGMLETRYRSFSNELWHSADDLGIRVPFGTQVDVASLFVERSLELLRGGGQFVALLPAKLFRSLHGAGLRRVVAEHRIQALHDFADAGEEMFDATVYPSVLEVEKRGEEGEGATTSREKRRRRGRRRGPRSGPRRHPIELSIWRGDSRASWEADFPDLLALDGDPSEPWLTVPPRVAEVFADVRSESRPLGGVESLGPARGVMTGANDVFVLGEEEARRKLGEVAESWTRWAVSGSDIRACDVATNRRLVWPCDDEGRVREELPGELRTYFAEHEEQLRSRADHRDSRPLWQLFRLKAGLTEPKVVWRDLAPKLEAALAGPERVPLNTVYFISCRHRRLARVLVGLFNSEVVRSMAYALGERARGGWRRHFSWVMRMLPIPSVVEEMAAREPEWEADAGELGDFGDWVEDAKRLEPTEEVDRGPVARLYGIDGSQVRRLRRWREGRLERGERAA